MIALFDRGKIWGKGSFFTQQAQGQAQIATGIPIPIPRSPTDCQGYTQKADRPTWNLEPLWDYHHTDFPRVGYPEP